MSLARNSFEFYIIQHTGAFSGTGFKFGPVIGPILGQLALQETPSYDISAFRIGRFGPKIQLKSSI